MLFRKHSFIITQKFSLMCVFPMLLEAPVAKQISDHEMRLSKWVRRFSLLDKQHLPHFYNCCLYRKHQENALSFLYQLGRCFAYLAFHIKVGLQPHVCIHKHKHVQTDKINRLVGNSICILKYTIPARSSQETNAIKR